MAQNITLLGASYSDVPAVILPKTGGGTARFDDASVTTASASDVASGKIFLASDGTITTGTNSGGGGAVIEPLSVTENGTYTAPSGVDGYSPITVNVSGGGGSSAWTKVAETSYQVSTTSTSAGTVDTLATGHSELWTSSKWVYVRIRDTAGKRNGYFYGSDQFFFNVSVANSSTTSTSVSTVLRICTCYSDNTFAVNSGTSSATGNGVYADQLTSDGNIRIRRRYSSTNSLTVNGTYKVEVYLLNTPDGVPIFN